MKNCQEMIKKIVILGAMKCFSQTVDYI